MHAACNPNDDSYILRYEFKLSQMNEKSKENET